MDFDPIHTMNEIDPIHTKMMEFEPLLKVSGAISADMGYGVNQCDRIARPPTEGDHLRCKLNAGTAMD